MCVEWMNEWNVMAAGPPASDPWLVSPFEMEGLHPTLHSSKHCLNAKDPLKCHFLREATPPTLLGPHAASVSPTCPSGPPWNSSHMPPCRSSNVPPTFLTKSCCLCPECTPRHLHGWLPPFRSLLKCHLIRGWCHALSSYPWSPNISKLCLSMACLRVFTATSSVPRIRPCT